MMTLDLEAARLEVRTKSAEQIERETSFKWCARAMACYELAAETGEIRWLLQAEDYRHESLEHASLIEDHGVTVRHVQNTLDRHRARVA